jgi:ubiquinone biosynthesis protein COQ4
MVSQAMTEERAVRIALSENDWARLALAGRSLFRLLRDPDDTRQVFFVGIALNGPKLPALLGRIAMDPAGLALLCERPRLDSSSVDWAHLRALPADTLGGAYVRYLDDHQLDPDLFQPPPGLPVIPQWVAQRIRQTHDLWHVLTGYAPDVRGELALQAFTFGQLRMPSAWLVSVLGTLAKVPTAAATVWRGFRRGARAKFLPVIRFEDHWDRPLATVRAELGIETA